MRIREGWREQRGAALAMVLAVAVCFSIAAFTALILALSRPRTKDFYKRRAVAQYAAEAGLVWAMQRLWNEAGTPYPPGCPVGGTGTDTVTVNGVPSTITVTNCGAGRNHTVKSKVTF